MDIYSLEKLMSETRRVAAEYRRSTGKALPVSGELAVYDGIRLLGLQSPPEEAAGYDALWERPGGNLRIQIKGRVVFDESRGGQRIGQIKQEQQWDCLALVIMDENYETEEIFMALREDVIDALDGASEARRKRGAISINRFRIIGERVWSSGSGTELEQVWADRDVS